MLFQEKRRKSPSQFALMSMCARARVMDAIYIYKIISRQPSAKKGGEKWWNSLITFSYKNTFFHRHSSHFIPLLSLLLTPSAVNFLRLYSLLLLSRLLAHHLVSTTVKTFLWFSKNKKQAPDDSERVEKQADEIEQNVYTIEGWTRA